MKNGGLISITGVSRYANRSVPVALALKLYSNGDFSLPLGFIIELTNIGVSHKMRFV